MIKISKIDEIITDLLQDCENDLFEYENIEENKAKMIYDNVKLFTLKLKDKINDETTNNSNILNMYDLVFQDAVKCCLEDINYEEDKIVLTEQEIKRIAYKMIYKNEYIWEIINETIKDYIDDILKEREQEDNE